MKKISPEEFAAQLEKERLRREKRNAERKAINQRKNNRIRRKKYRESCIKNGSRNIKPTSGVKRKKRGRPKKRGFKGKQKTTSVLQDIYKNGPRPKEVSKVAEIKPKKNAMGDYIFKATRGRYTVEQKRRVDFLKKRYYKFQKKKKGRPAIGYLPFEYARDYLRTLSLKSKIHYLDWHDENHIVFVPKYPDSYYKRKGVWEGWNDFLGNKNNQFGARIDRSIYRPFEEAMLYVQSVMGELGITKTQDYYDCHDAGKFPEDIPKFPFRIYDPDDWCGWDTWLGHTLADRIEAKQQVIPIFAVAHQEDDPNNVLTVMIHTTGLTTLKELCLNEHMVIVKLFDYNPDLGEQVKQIINEHSTAFYDMEHKRLCPNYNELLFDLGGILSWYN